jgi:hypothetical protein
LVRAIEKGVLREPAEVEDELVVRQIVIAVTGALLCVTCVAVARAAAPPPSTGEGPEDAANEKSSATMFHTVAPMPIAMKPAAAMVAIPRDGVSAAAQ